MLEVKDIATMIESNLNTNTMGKTFSIYADVGELKKRASTQKRNEPFRSGIVDIMASDINKILGKNFVTLTTRLTLYADKGLRGFDSHGDAIEVLEIQQILNELIDSLNGTTTAQTIGGKVYSVTHVFRQRANVLPEVALGQISEAVPLVLLFNITVFENGVNANNWNVEINGEPILTTSTVLTRTKVIENTPLKENKSTKATVQTNGFGLDFVAPQLNNDLSDKFEAELLGVEQDTAFCVYLKGNKHDNAFICVGGNSVGSLTVNQNVGFNISLLEGVPDLLEYDEKWANADYDSLYDGFGYAEVRNPDEEEVIVFWGDGSFSKSSDESILHEYADTGFYSIRVFNKDLADIEIDSTSILELDDITYSLVNDEIWVTLVNENKKLYIMPDEFEIDGVFYPVKKVGLYNSPTSINTQHSVVYIADGVTELGNVRSDFLRYLRLPVTIDTIGIGSLVSCIRLKTIVVDSTVNYDENTDGLYVINEQGVATTSGIALIFISSSGTAHTVWGVGGAVESLIIPTQITSLGAYAFRSCAHLEEIHIPNAVRAIGINCFELCTALKTVTFDDNLDLNTIPEYCFYGTALETITIPQWVDTIGDHAFENCLELAEFVCLAVTPPALGVDAFLNCPLTSIKVPAIAVNVYKAITAWQPYADIITAIEE